MTLRPYSAFFALCILSLLVSACNTTRTDKAPYRQGPYNSSDHLWDRHGQASQAPNNIYAPQAQTMNVQRNTPTATPIDSNTDMLAQGSRHRFPQGQNTAQNQGYVSDDGVFYPSGRPQEQGQGQQMPQFSQNASNAQSNFQNNASQNNFTSNQNVKVAFLAPLSGQHQNLGEAMQQAAQLAIFDMGYTNLELIPRDTGGTPQGAQRAAQDALANGADIILGPLFSGSVQAVRPVAESQNKLAIGFSTDWRVAGGNAFIMGVLPFAQASTMAEYAASQQYRRIGILAPDDEYGRAVAHAFEQRAVQLGLTIADKRFFGASNQEMTETAKIFSRFEARSAAMEEEENLTPPPLPFDAVFLPVGGDQAVNLVNLLSYYDMSAGEIPYLGTGLWDDDRIFVERGLQGAVYAAPSPTLRLNFEQNYANVYGQTPPRLASIAYDATALVTVLAKQAAQQGQSPLRITRSMMLNPNGFAGLDGIFRFRSDGLVERGLAIHRIAAGQSTVIKEAPKTFQSSNF